MIKDENNFDSVCTQAYIKDWRWVSLSNLMNTHETHSLSVLEAEARRIPG